MSATDDVGDGDDGCPGSEFTGGGSQDVRGLALVLVDSGLCGRGPGLFEDGCLPSVNIADRMLVFLAYTVEIMYPSSLPDLNLTLPAHSSSPGRRAFTGQWSR